MQKAHEKLPIMVDVQPLKEALARNSHLFDQFPQRRTAPGSPHAEMTDIWIRYNDPTKYVESGDFSGFADEHDSVWYDSYYQLPEVKKPIFDIMAAVNGERLGGVLITKLPPGGKIAPHTDGGWHAAYYDKFYVPIQNERGAVFGFEDGVVDPEEGEVYQFDNSRTHWVENNSNIPRIAMIVCIRLDKGSEG